MAAVRYLEFSKFGILATWPVSERYYTSSYQISHQSDNIPFRYSQKRFSIWRQSAILNLQNFDILLTDCFWNENLRLHTKSNWKWMILGWDIAIKPFFKMAAVAIANFRSLAVWSRDLCLNVIILPPAKFRINQTINRGDIAIFNMAAVCHFEFAKFWYFVTWPSL